MEILRQESGVVCARGDLHISEVEVLRTALLSELAAAPALQLDLSGVSSCDTASLQLLCSLHTSARRVGKQLRIVSPSAVLREASAILGLSLEEPTNLSRAGQP